MFGSNGNDVFLCTSFIEVKSVLEDIFQRSYSASICPFYEIDIEYRLIYLNGECKLIYGKKAACGNWKNNLNQGAEIIDIVDEDTTNELLKISSQLIPLFEREFISIDIIKLVTGEFMIIEINSNVVMMKYSNSSLERRKKAKEIYREAVLYIMNKKGEEPKVI